MPELQLLIETPYNSKYGPPPEIGFALLDTSASTPRHAGILQTGFSRIL